VASPPQVQLIRGRGCPREPLTREDGRAVGRLSHWAGLWGVLHRRSQVAAVSPPFIWIMFLTPSFPAHARPRRRAPSNIPLALGSPSGRSEVHGAGAAERRPDASLRHEHRRTGKGRPGPRGVFPGHTTRASHGPGEAPPRSADARVDGGGRDHYGRRDPLTRDLRAVPSTGHSLATFPRSGHEE